MRLECPDCGVGMQYEDGLMWCENCGFEYYIPQPQIVDARSDTLPALKGEGHPDGDATKEK